MDIKIQKSVQSVTIEPHKIEVEKEDDEDLNEAALVQESPVKSVAISSKESEKSASVTQKLDQ